METTTYIIPNEVDTQRGKDLQYKSTAQVNAQIKSIKDVDKILRRGVAFGMAHHWLGEYNVKEFRNRAIKLRASEEKIRKFDCTIKDVIACQEAKRKEKEDARVAKYKPIKDFLKEKFEAKMLKKAKGTLRNLGNYRSHVGKHYSEGDTLAIKNFKYEWGYTGYQRTVPLRVWVQLTFLDGYFATRDETYGFYLEYTTEGIFQLNTWGTKSVVKLGKKDTAKLNELLKDIKSK